MKYNTKTMNYLRMAKILVGGVILSICFSINLNAQSQNLTGAQKKTFKKNFKEGTVLMENGVPNRTDEKVQDTTLRYFLKCYSMDSNNANFAYLVGKLYLGTAMHKAQALPYLEKAVRDVKKKYYPGSISERHAPPLAYYYLARAEHVNYQFDDAIDNFNVFKKMLKPGSNRNKDITYWINCCNSGKDLVKSPVDCKVVNIGETVNSVYDDYAPIITADESEMYFTSKRPLAEDTANNREGVWVTTAGAGKVWGAPQDPGSPLNEVGGNTATVWLAADGQKMIVYKSISVTNGMLYATDLEGGNWAKPSLIDTGDAGVIDAKHSNYYTPSACISPDGNTIYFSSDRPGGLGGLDLYESDLQKDGTWGSATNMGPAINTPYDEDCPFVSFDGYLLFFSSKGHNTMGGYDVFMSKGGQGNWGDPQNLGYPVNTPDDDKYFVLTPDGKRGYYNTVRLGTMGERDIYEVTFNNALPVQCVGVLVGYVKMPDGFSIPQDAKVTATLGTTSHTVMVNTKTGKFLAVLQAGKNYSIVVTAGGKEMNKYNYTIPLDSAYCTVPRSFYNQKIILGDTTNVFRPKPAPPRPVDTVKPNLLTFSKFFGYNLNDISEKDPDFSTFVRNIDSAAAKTKVVVTIDASASKVPTSKFGNNFVLARSRAESLEKALSKYCKNLKNVKFDLKSNVNGPEYAKDYENRAKYADFQYVKGYIRIGE